MNQRVSHRGSGDITLWGIRFPESLAAAARDYHTADFDPEPSKQRLVGCIQRCVETFQSSTSVKVSQKRREDPRKIALQMVEKSPLMGQIKQRLWHKEKLRKLNEEKDRLWGDLSLPQREALAGKFNEAEQLAKGKLGEEYMEVIIPGADWALSPKQLKRTQAKHVLERAVELIGRGLI